MSDPPRLRDLGGVPGSAGELLRGARRSRPMTSAERSRSAMRVDRLAVLPMAAGVLLWLKGVAMAAGFAITAIAVVKVVDSQRAAPPPETTAPPPSMIAPASPPLSGQPAPNAEATPDEPDEGETPKVMAVSPSSRGSALPAAAPPPSAAPEPGAAPELGERTLVSPAPGAASLAREAAILERARALIATSPARALAELEAHAAAFPNGKLTLEREFLVIDALRRLGRGREARARGEALLRRSRGSLYEKRVQQILDELH